ncbi:MAG: HAMP domain-containing protein [Sphingomonadales bacterium]|jgi:two-component system nitrogen regulation sensor histidine kinase NtrY|nr:HAMP domain-containing protein [Sphingomonadales bacterium]MBK9003652.1 HAMP domain-containing protein [Sphingomonadales bacterium]MBK9268826.1 HAMP domain-containing protein [Sphingomonadales bacterium]MBP6435000.1 HAMP domain-containing protein [Sphingorhabdus sp.]
MATVSADIKPTSPGRLRNWLSGLAAWAGQAQRIRYLEIGSMLLLLVMASFTAYVLVGQGTGSEPLSPPVAAALLIANLLPATSLLMLAGRRLAIARAKQDGEGEGSLHVRLVIIFSMLAAVPALLLAIFASVLFQSGVQFWFSNSAQGMLENAGALAKGYYEEKLRDVGDETVAMAGDIRFALDQTAPTDPQFLSFYYDQVLRRKLSESAIVTVARDGAQRTLVVASSQERKGAWISGDDLKRLGSGEDLIVTAQPNQIVAVNRLFDSPRTYLYASRTIEVPSFTLGEKAQSVLADYKAMEARSRNLQLQFNALLYVVSLLIIGVAVWVALLVADRLVRPVNDLVDAAQRIADGDLSIRVAEEDLRKDEVGFLSQSFNRMTERLQSQTQTLLSANRQLDNRRAFIETVLESVSAAIVNVDKDGFIRLANGTAEKLLSKNGKTVVGMKLEEAAPFISDLPAEGRSHAILQVGDGTEPQTLAIKITDGEGGQVVTFEDITQQLSDQRRAAWSDVARRIAHEIKNPLTPIQLAAERLRRRFGKQIEDGSDIFDQLTGTIIRQVGDLRNIADEFSSFARMPKPVFRDENLADIVGHAVFLFEVANTDIEFVFDQSASGAVPMRADRRQLGQAVTNILKNAVESIGQRNAGGEGPTVKGRVEAMIQATPAKLTVRIADNGMGLPPERDRIVEPYVTTRATGSGLGLAIVKKIVEEHQGTLTFSDNTDGGAVVSMCFDLIRLDAIATGSTVPGSSTDNKDSNAE